MSQPPVILLLGTPFSGIEAQAQRLAGDHGHYLGDLQLSAVDTIGQLLELHQLAQIPQHEPLYAALRQHLPRDAADPARFLSDHADRPIADLLSMLVASAGSGRGAAITVADTAAGFRISQVERWMAWLPDALFVHVTTPAAAFVEQAIPQFRSKLFVPADYRDHNLRHKAPQLHPELAWFQVHSTLARVCSDRSDRHCCRLDLHRLSELEAGELTDLAAQQRPSGALTWSYARDGIHMPETVPELARSIGC